MYTHKLDRLLHCPVTVALEVVGGKWKACLLYALKRGISRPSDLHRAIPTATRRVLNQQLRELQGHDMIGKTIRSVLPLQVDYFLTPQGQTLLTVIDALEAWGETHGESFRAQVAQQG